MKLKRQKKFKRNKKLEYLLQELNGLLGPVETEVAQAYKEPQHPVVLLVGCARSGTTLIMQWLARIGEFAYPTNFLSRFYAAPYIGARIQQMLSDPEYSFRDELSDFGNEISFESELGKTTGVLAPNEFYYFWRRFFQYGEIQYLDAQSLEAVDSKTFVAELAALESVFDKPLAMKGLLVNWNISFINSLLPRVLFVHVKRDTVYNAQSLLEARENFFGDQKLWYSFKPPEYPQLAQLDPYQQVVGQVHFTNLAIQKALAQVDANRWLQIEYEAFCKSPELVYRKIEQKLVSQGEQIAITYEGPSRFETTNNIRLSREHFGKLVDACGLFS